MKEALYYEKINDKVKCLLCPQMCIISENKVGFCRGRKNIGGKLYSIIYGKVSSLNLDPIEKKPLYHFYPGSKIISIGTVGCNLSCDFCQNWTISQSDSPTRTISPEEVVNYSKNSLGISYTYNEPFIWYEFVRDCAKLAKKQNLKNVLVTNGFINEEPLRELLPFIDALNIDLKAYDTSFYKKICKGKLNPVLETIKIANKHSFVEITNLIIPGLNDKERDIENLVEWVYNNVGKDVPLHFSRYFPNYKMDITPTPISTLRLAREIGRKKLNYVYLGNVWDEDENTYCPFCKKKIVERNGYTVSKINIVGGKCKFCENKISGKFN